MLIPQGYDPLTLNHWLWYKYLCSESTPSEFQRLFENILKRSKPEFMQIRPYGNIGDRKADGLFLANTTVFQVYSPDTLTQAKMIQKIDDDLDGAVSQWGDDLKEWIFVYNVRRGLPPDVPKALMRKKEQYPNIEIDHLSSDKLWEIARDLTLHQRAEILGAPSGYENAFLVPNKELSPSPSQEPPEDSWIMLIQDINLPIDVRATLEVLKPQNVFGAPVFVRPDPSSWEEAAIYQQKLINGLFDDSRRSLPPRFAVFSLAPIPLIVQLGFLLTDSIAVKYFKYHVDTQSWKWPVVETDEVDTNFHVTGLPSETVTDSCEVLIRVSLSAKIGKHETDEIISDLPVQIDMFVEKPTLTWIRGEEQLEKYAALFRDILAEIRAKVPHCTGIHLFFAGPAPIALITGQQINPRMNPPVYLYEYSKKTSPRYQYTFSLE